MTPAHIVFVSYYGFRCNSAGHIACLANELARLGVRVTVFVPDDKTGADVHGEINYGIWSYAEFPDWRKQAFRSGERTMVVAWTPRENVRKFVTSLCRETACPYLVHLEDNERLVTAVNLGRHYESLAALPAHEVSALLGVDERLSHPHFFPPFVHAASAVTFLIDRLGEFTEPGQRTFCFWPGFNEAYFGPKPLNRSMRRELRIADDELVFVYAGNAHSANRREVLSLYLTVGLLNRLGVSARLVRAGEDYLDLFEEPVPAVNSRVVKLGLLPPGEVADVMAMADVLVQPGRSDEFNDYRFPSKLPEFFATGRPVMLPRSNLGRFVRDGEDAIVLQRGDAFEIAEHAARLAANPRERDRLGAAASTFAEAHFRWSRIAGNYLRFLSTIEP